VVLVPRDEVLQTGLAVEEGVRIILRPATRRLASFREASGPRAPGGAAAPIRNRLTEREELAEEEVICASMAIALTHGNRAVSRAKSPAGQ